MSSKNALILIITISILIPSVVGILIFSPYKISSDASWIRELPAFHAFINGLTAAILMMARYFIRIDQRLWHKWFMELAFVLGALFLISYIVYHSNVDSVIYGDMNGNGILEDSERLRVGNIRYVYLSLLLSHILLSISVVPLVLFSFYFALTEKFQKHLKLVKYAWPIWLYVSVSGVLVYFMISPYYQ